MELIHTIISSIMFDVFDARICLDQKFLENIGFKVWTLGITD